MDPCADGSNISNFIEMFMGYAMCHHHVDLLNILRSQDLANHYAVLINGLQLFETCVEMYRVRQPLKVLTDFDKALVRASAEICDTFPAGEGLTVKPHVHARIRGIPACSPEVSRNFIPKSEDVGSLLSVSGTVIRATLAKILETEKQYKCVKCEFTFMAKVDIRQFNVIDKPTKCPNPESCNSTKFSHSGEHVPTSWRDYQEVKIQERVQDLSVRSLPRAIWILLEDDLVDCCKPGDDVTVVGTVIQRWRPVAADARVNTELAIVANHVDVNNEQRSQAAVTPDLKKEFEEFWQTHQSRPLHGRNIILSQFCPQIYGLYQVKLAVVLVLAGGVSKCDSGTRVRGESHFLLIGDPGTGKSQFLKYATKLFPRSVLTTGIGSTSAGLTVAAVKEGAEWQLEAGALVLSDGGLCCIDEFNSIREADRSSILEAMEQQTISVAKAGIVCKLNSRCTVLAATNPKGSYDPNLPIEVNVALSTPLLSRFDLIMVLVDSREERWDKLISGYILDGQSRMEHRGTQSARWTMDKMQCYFCLIKSLKPKMSPDALTILQKYYLFQRRSTGQSAARTTVRMLESLIRLSEAHAKLMFRSDVCIMDAVVAVALVESSMQSVILVNEGNVLHTTFPDDPEEEYLTLAEGILKKLELNYILEKVVSERRQPTFEDVSETPKEAVQGPSNDVNADGSNSTLSELFHRPKGTSTQMGQEPLSELNESESFSPILLRSQHFDTPRPSVSGNRGMVQPNSSQKLHLTEDSPSTTSGLAPSSIVCETQNNVASANVAKSARGTNTSGRLVSDKTLDKLRRFSFLQDEGDSINERARNTSKVLQPPPPTTAKTDSCRKDSDISDLNEEDLNFDSWLRK